MTQGSNMNPTTPAAIISQQPIAAPTIVQQWKELARTQQNGPADHAIYALARIIYALREEPDQLVVRQAALKKIIRTFTPITNRNKLANGQTEFGTAKAQMYSITAWSKNYSQLQLSDEEFATIKLLAKDLHVELRSRIRADLLQYVIPTPVRVKVPYTG